MAAQDQKQVKLAKQLLELKQKIKAEEKIIAGQGEKINSKNVATLERLKKQQKELNKLKSVGEKASMDASMELSAAEQLRVDLSKKFFTMEKKGTEVILTRTQEYFKQGNHLHKFLSTNLQMEKQYLDIESRIKGITHLLGDDMPAELQAAGLDLQEFVSSQVESLDLSQKLLIEKIEKI